MIRCGAADPGTVAESDPDGTTWSPISSTSAETLITNAWYSKTVNVTFIGMDLSSTTYYG